MRAAVVVVVLRVSTLHAEPFRPRLENLHVSVNCADYWVSSERGLQVMVDGVPQRAAGENGAPATGYTSDGTPYSTWVTTDVAYAIAPGIHHLAISAPGCSALEEDIDTTSILPISVSGRLPVAEPSLRGPTGAPNGIGVASGVYIGGRGAYTGTNDIFSTHYDFERVATTGGFLTTSVERRGIAFAYDMLVARGATAGMVTATESSPFTGSVVQIGMAARLGMRQRFGEIAFAEGAGIGGDMWIHSVTETSATTTPPSEIDGDFYVPLWGQLTYKPGCSWGAQVLAAYDVHPGSSNEDVPTVMAGVMWQPNSACAETGGLALR
jgi:hypothetical protein